MSDENDLTPAQGTLQDEEAAMAAAFAEARGEEPPQPPATEQQPAGDSAGEQPTVTAGAPSGADPAPAAAPAPEPTMAERIAAIEAENRRIAAENASLKSGMNSIAGRLGGLNQAVQRFEQAKQQLPAGHAAIGAARKIVAEQLKRVNEDYPGLAESLANDLSEILATPADGAAPPQIDIEAIKSEAEYAAVSRVERRELERQHPNWEVDIALKDELGRPLKDASGRYLPSPVLLDWLETKPEHYRNQFTGAVDADFLSSCLREFKEYRQQRQGSSPARPAATSAPARADAAPASSRQARLAAAVTPKPLASAATPQPQLTEEQAMQQGWNAVRNA